MGKLIVRIRARDATASVTLRSDWKMNNRILASKLVKLLSALLAWITVFSSGRISASYEYRLHVHNEVIKITTTTNNHCMWDKHQHNDGDEVRHGHSIPSD